MYFSVRDTVLATAGLLGVFKAPATAKINRVFKVFKVVKACLQRRSRCVCASKRFEHGLTKLENNTAQKNKTCAG